ncbi:MAG: substrate-binding domain-containing protein [Spirochaetes bacterium]|nr:substrate-binding domain-containing protein [Spirochaetota bacterium]
MATVNDVAKLAGVSAMTVSRTLNSPESVRVETRDRVLAAIEKLDYMPNRRARSLITGTFHTIAIFVPTVLNPFFGQVALGVEDEATSHGFNVILCNADSAEKQQLQLDAMIQLGVDGIVFFDMPVNRALVDRLQRAGVVAVLVDNELDVDDVCALRTNNRLGGKIATAHLIELDHRRIGHIHGRVDDGAADGAEDEQTQDRASSAPDGAPAAFYEGSFQRRIWRERLAGFREVMDEAGVDIDPLLVVEGDGTSEGGVDGGRRAMEELLALDEPPTAVYAANDLMAIGAIQAALKSGLRVPEDISIVGFDDIDLSSMIHPPLTTVHQPRREMGRESVRLLMERIDGDSPVKNLLLNPSLVERGSTAAQQRSTS